MNVGDVFASYRPDGSEFDRVRVVALDSANDAVVIIPDGGGFTTPIAVESAGFSSYYGLAFAAEAASAAWETPSAEVAA